MFIKSVSVSSIEGAPLFRDIFWVGEWLFLLPLRGLYSYSQVVIAFNIVFYVIISYSGF